MTNDIMVHGGVLFVLALSAGLILRKKRLPKGKDELRDDDVHWL